MTSTKLRMVDGVVELSRDSPEIKADRRWAPNMYFDDWSVDAPERGFLKRFRRLNDSWWRLDALAYRKPKAAVNDALSKQ